MISRCTLLDEDGEDLMCLLEEGHDGLCRTAVDIEDEWPETDAIVCDASFYGGGSVRLLGCTLPAGHNGPHARVQPLHRQCPGFVHDIKNNKAHCVRPEGHSGPHAAGWSLDAPEVCGEAERGTGRTCLRQPHPHWPDAHDFGADHENMTTPPDWWPSEWGEWPGGPVGNIPDVPFWFWPPQRPADDQESIANRQDVDEVKSRRHHGGGVGYGQGEDHETVVSVADIRAMIDMGVQHLNESSIGTSGANENTKVAAGFIQTCLNELTDQAGGVHTLKQTIQDIIAGLEDVRLGTTVPGRGLAGAENAATAAMEKAEAAAITFSAASQGSSNDSVQAASAGAYAAAGEYGEASGPLIVAGTRVEEAVMRLRIMADALESLLAQWPQTQLEEALAATGRVTAHLETGYTSAMGAIDQAQTYTATL